MDIWKIFIACILEIVLLLHLSAAQVLMEELRQYAIDDRDMNGTEQYTQLTIDQVIMQASGGPGLLQNLILGDDGTILAELDMRLTKDQYFNLYDQHTAMAQSLSMPREKRRAFRKLIKENNKKAKRTKRKAIRDEVLRWPEGVMPYRFVPGHFQDKERYMIRSAMTEWEKYTCLRFREKRSTDYNVVRFQNGLGCNSQLGMVRGEQPLNLDRNGCRFKGLYLHEIGHAIGLVHEHQLPNRDDFIEILEQNVQPNMRIWFNKYSSQEVDQMKVPYEYSSVMHYGITAFSHDGKAQTIRAKQTAKEKTIGRVYKKELSFTDVKIVNLMYGCADHCDKSIICNNGGYVDQNCKCICPDNTDSCTKDNKDPIDHTCFNAHEDWQCGVWANQGECDRNPRFMLDGCKKACHLCGKKDETDDTCKDSFGSSKCKVWQYNGECIVNKKWMEKHCRATCKACKDSGPDPDVACDNKHSDDAQCEKWATEGECQINPVWMPENCRKSCHMCGDDGKRITTTTPLPTEEPGKCEDKHNSVECKGWADSGECDLNPDWMIPNCRQSCGKCGDSGKAECKNTWNDRQCEGWSRDAECIKNSVWMKKNCYKACSECSADNTTPKQRTEVTTRATTREDSASCKNNHRNEKECDTWAKYGHCKINKWMTVHCAKSCGECSGDVTTTTPQKKDRVTPSACKDSNKHCSAWARHRFCEDNPTTALKMCKKSCNFCDNGKTECFDSEQLCPMWAQVRQCERNPSYMLRYCRKSCRVC